MKSTHDFSKTLKSVLPLSLLFSVSAAMAQEIDSSVIVSAEAVNYYFNDDKGQQDDLGYQFGLEVPVWNRWSLNLKYLDVNSKLNNSNQESDVDFVHAGSIYNFAAIRGFQPYAGVGFGDLTVTRPALAKLNRSTVNLSVGTKYNFGSRWLGKVEAMMIEPTGSLDRDMTLSASLGVRLGRVSSRTAPVALAPEVVQLDMDSDGDGVIDRNDDCPNTSPNVAVDEFGCVILDADQRRQVLQVGFDFDQSVVKDQYLPEIEAFAVFMRRYAETSAVIEGHTTRPCPYDAPSLSKTSWSTVTTLMLHACPSWVTVKADRLSPMTPDRVDSRTVALKPMSVYRS
jgi:hypothetical protein